MLWSNNLEIKFGVFFHFCFNKYKYKTAVRIWLDIKIVFFLTCTNFKFDESFWIKHEGRQKKLLSHASSIELDCQNFFK